MLREPRGFTDQLNEINDLRILTPGRCKALSSKAMNFEPRFDICAARIELFGHDEPVYKVIEPMI